LNLAFSEEDLTFRQDVKDFLAARLPEDIRDRCARGHIVGSEDLVRWQKILYAQGWMAPNWPVEYGGTGWTLTQKYIAAQEFSNACAPLPTFGITMLGPVLIAFGNQAQKAYYLPRILKSDDVWCQGYSEPGAGSDLAQLKTRAVRDGDHYLINGHKIWTSYAHWANRMFCLVRTDPNAKAQEGISFILIDMSSAGIEVKPIIGLDMGHTLNEVFLDNVKVPVENLVGEENKGWTYAKYLLQKERNFVARVAQSRHLVQRLKTIASEQRVGEGCVLDSPDFRRRLTSLEVDLRALEYTELRYLSKDLSGETVGPQPSVMKI
jgi:alkylation response protein AidB-like acyl-CoA dehydrogenase